MPFGCRRFCGSDCSLKLPQDEDALECSGKWQRVLQEVRTPEIRSLQVGRAIAAMAVVLHHAAEYGTAKGVGAPGLVYDSLWRGYLGVDFFFVLSGFIILHSHFDDPRSFSAARRYASKRLTRIYVPYLPVGAAMVVALAAFPVPRDWSIVTSLTLLPTHGEPALSVAWTLVHEMVFYAIFALSYLTARFVWLIGLWAILIFAIAAVGGIIKLPVPSYALPLARVLFDPINLEFIAGMGAALLCRTSSSRLWPVFLPLGIAAVLLFFLYPALNRAWFGFAMALVVISVVDLERRGHMIVPQLLVYLGGASYAIYLLHLPAMIVCARIGSAFGVDNWFVTIPLLILVGVAAGVLYHQVYERPALRYVGRLLRIQRTTASAPGMALEARASPFHVP